MRESLTIGNLKGDSCKIAIFEVRPTDCFETLHFVTFLKICLFSNCKMESPKKQSKNKFWIFETIHIIKCRTPLSDRGVAIELGGASSETPWANVNRSQNQSLKA